ncbi:MAG: helix-turn-helix domain-containing protein [Tannerellaceae bacterium]|nr:helix-turn-helix domain-containing protein [Tannerellaceae bacterium]MCD7914363.1 helix-turn-helix domain-containing protein [Tannerellaceae bacterium]
MLEEEKVLIKKIVLKVKKLRREAEVSQRLMYYDTEINMGRLETGTHNINITTIKKICDYFHISLEEFFKGI